MSFSRLVYVALATMITGPLVAFEYSQKTFLMPRAIAVNKSIESTTWHAHLYEKRYQERDINTHFQLTPFFQQTMNRDEAGRYFAVGNGTNTVVVGNLAGTPATDVSGDAFAAVAGKRYQGTMVLNPDQSMWGIRLDFLQAFKSPVDGLFFKITAPFVTVANHMNMTVTNGQAVSLYTDGPAFTLQDYFAGKTALNVSTRQDLLRSPLTQAKIFSRRSATGFADLDLMLGYRCHQSDKRRVALNAAVTVPTGNRAHGEFMFEPIYGNGKHAGLGCGVDAGLQLWQDKQGEVWCDVGLAYKYLFEGTEARTVGVKGKSYGQYYLASYTHSNVNPQSFFPVANLLTQDLRVKPGSQLEAIANLSFKCRFLIADIGYNLYWKDQESLWIKAWNDDTVGLISGTPATNDAITSANFIDGRYLNRADLDPDAAKTPAQLTHKIHAAIALHSVLPTYCPLSFAFGGSYEYAEDNSAMEQYAVWVKLAFSI